MAAPGAYAEARIRSSGAEIILSIYEFRRDSPCVVFLPGTMTHPLFYGVFLGKLRDKGFNVVGIHFVAHGKSPRARELFSFGDLVQNVIDAVSYCVEHYNENIVLLGSSQGGILCLAAAIADHRIKAILPHNIALFSMPDTIDITIYPTWLKPFYKKLIKVIAAAAKIVPSLQVPLGWYLSFKKVTASPRIKRQFFSDQIGRVAYPLFFLSSMISYDLSGVADGRIACPVIAIINRGDSLFPYRYSMAVYEKIMAPKKERLEFDVDCHLIFNECVDQVFERVLGKIREYC